jgi:RimJ/RimL family protein N-acetyltransferase
MADELELRPPGEDDLAVIEALTQDPDGTGEFSWYGWHDPLRWRRRWAQTRLIDEDGGLLMVVLGSRPLGLVSWRRRQATPASYYWEIGIALLAAARGAGHGTQAQRLLARYLFAHTPVHRIMASTEVANRAERRALEKIGFTAEGISRGIGWRDGQWRDGVTYSLLRTDPSP